MTVELRPLGVACNLSCHYCYQNPQREAGNHRTPYNLDLMKEETLRVGGPFTLFGGEPLLMKFADLEDLFAWGMKEFGRSSIQTNGVLIEDRHIDLFRRCKVSVGLSLDGPGDLNDARWNGGLEKTRAATARIEDAIARLCAAGVKPGLIVTLHRGNATPDKIPRMVEWFRSLDALGIRSVRLHLLEVDDQSVRHSLTLTPKENVEALLAFAQAEKDLKNIRFDMFADMEQLLQGNDSKVSCVWRACDPYTTEAVKGIEGNGQASNCGRTNKDGIDFIKAESPGFERYVALYNTPQSENGCSGCRFFLMCKGQCPGTSVGGDWRNRTENCTEWKQLFSLLETRLVQRGKIPLTLQPVRPELERRQVEAWRQGRNPPIHQTLRSLLDGIARGEPADQAVPQMEPVRKPAPARISWVGRRARDYWKPRLDRLRAMLEEATVYAGREAGERCSVRRVPETSFERLTNLAARLGVETAIFPAGALPASLCTHFGAEPSGIVAVGNRDAVRRARAAWESGDREEFHSRLDLPSCCLGRPARAPDSAGTIHVPETIPFHPLLAPVGLSALPVLPCRFDCRRAMEAARTFLSVAADSGYEEEVRDLYECLSWKVLWTELHGVTEVKTPVFKLCHLSETDAGPKRIVREGARTVEFAGSGLSFPFDTTRKGTRAAAVPEWAAPQTFVQLSGIRPDAPLRPGSLAPAVRQAVPLRVDEERESW